VPTPEEIQKKLIEAICAVQRDSGEPEPTLTVKSCPMKDLRGFDSPLGVVVTGLVAIGLGIEIPLELNVFVDDKKRRLTIEESAALICSVVTKNGANK
jgi:hypothetical protein